MNMQGEWIRVAAQTNTDTRSLIPAIITLLVASLVFWAGIGFLRTVYRKSRNKATTGQQKAASSAAPSAAPAAPNARAARALVAFQAADVMKEGRQENYKNWVRDLLAETPDTECYEGMNDDHIRDAGYFNEDEPVWELDLRGVGNIRLVADTDTDAASIRVLHTRCGDLGTVPARYAGRVNEVIRAEPYRIRWRISGGNYKYYNREHSYIKTTKAPYGVYIELLEE